MKKSARVASVGVVGILGLVACSSAVVVGCGSDDTSGAVTSPSDGGLGGDSTTGTGTGTGTVDGGHVTFAPDGSGYVLGGQVSGLAGNGLTLSDGNGQSVTVAENGSFVFPNALMSGQSYNVSVSTQPAVPTQNCMVANGQGTANANIASSVTVTCTTGSYAIGGTVTGLNAAFDAGTLPVADGGTDAGLDAGDAGDAGAFEAGDAGDAGDASDGGDDDAAVDGSTGTTTTADAGVPDSALVLQNGTDQIVVTASGPFTFPTKVLSDGTFSVSVARQPLYPAQNCRITGGAGVVVAGDVTSVAVNCTTDQYTYGGTVSGLTGTLVLQDINGATQTINMNGSYAFTPVNSSQLYDVTVQTQPAGQSCSIANASGTIGEQDTTNINVTCTNITVGGTLSGLTGGSVTLQDNHGDDLTLSANGSFTFATPVSDGYLVTVETQPTFGRTCTVSRGAGSEPTASVTDVSVTCKDSVLVVYGANNTSYGADMQSSLVGTGAFQSVDLSIAQAATPSVAALEAYTAVLVSSDGGSFADPVSLGNNLADYFDAGGRVVLSTFANASIPVTGRFGTDANGYTLISATGQGGIRNGALGTELEPTSPLLAGVTNFSCALCYDSSGALVNGAVAVADYLGTTTPLIVRGAVTVAGVVRKRADLNFYPVSAGAAPGFGWVGDGATLMKNALLYY